MKTQKFLIFFLFLLPMFSLTSCGDAEVNEENSDTAKQEEKIDFDNAFIVDVRTPEEFNEGSFEGAVNIPLSTVEENVDQFKGKDQVVIFCKSGNRAGKAIKILEDHGIEGAINGVNQEHLEEVEGE